MIETFQLPIGSLMRRGLLGKAGSQMYRIALKYFI